MAVIISDMELPEDCCDCREQFGCTHFKVLLEGRPNDCPLKEVPEEEWIPVSERLPDPYMFVNATCRSLVDDRDDWVVETLYLPIPKEYNPKHYSDWGNIPMLNWGEAEVIAWMKRIIPEPYKMAEEQQGENTDGTD